MIYLLITIPPVLLFLYLYFVGEDLMDSIIELVIINGSISQGKYLFLLLVSHAFVVSAAVVINLYPDALSSQDSLVLYFSYLIIFLFLIMTSGIRRLRDIGWNSYLILIPFIHIIILFVPATSIESKKVKKLEKKVKIAELKKKLKELEDE